MSAASEWYPHAVVATIVENQGRFLVVEELVDGQRVINQPAGHVDEGETILQAAKRETLEETAWEVEPTELIGMYVLHAANGITYHRLCFAAKAIRQTDNPLDKDILGPLWLTRDELASGHYVLRSPLVLKCIDDYLAGRRFPLDFIYEAPRG
ncbi:MAG TPA: NUDIX hydrolase [Pseudomonadales bacterium]|nr:NUDIX hydrolase [Pseudomonadales bacterium]